MQQLAPGHVVLTDEEAQRFNTASPGLGYFFQLIHDFAVAQGGDVLAVWECLRGPLFGETTVMTSTVAAQQLGLPLSTVSAVYDQTRAAVMPAWQSSPQAAAWHIQAKQLSAQMAAANAAGMNPPRMSSASPHAEPDCA